MLIVNVIDLTKLSLANHVNGSWSLIGLRSFRNYVLSLLNVDISGSIRIIRMLS